MRLNGLQDGSVITYVDKLKAILNSAVDNEIILRNPCKYKISHPKTNKTALTSSQLQELLLKVRAINYRYYIIL